MQISTTFCSVSTPPSQLLTTMWCISKSCAAQSIARKAQRWPTRMRKCWDRQASEHEQPRSRQDATVVMVVVVVGGGPAQIH